MAQPKDPVAYRGRNRLPIIDKSRVKVLFSSCGHLEPDTVAHAIWTSMLKKQLLSDRDVSLPISTALPCPRCSSIGPFNVADIVRDWTLGIYNSGDWQARRADDADSGTRDLIEIGWILSIIADQRIDIKLEVYSTMLRQLAFVCVHIIEEKQHLSSFLRIADSALGKRDAWRFYRAVSQEKERRRKRDTKSKLHDYYNDQMDSVLDRLRETVDLVYQLLRPHNELGSTGTVKKVRSTLNHLSAALISFRDVATRARELKAEVELQHSDAQTADGRTIRTFLRATVAERTRLSEENRAFAASYERLEEELGPSSQNGPVNRAWATTKLALLQCRAERLHEETCKLQTAIKTLDRGENEARIGILNDCAWISDGMNVSWHGDQLMNNEEEEDNEKLISSSSSAYSRD